MGFFMHMQPALPAKQREYQSELLDQQQQQTQL
jgi:hypothetical protein